MPFSPHQILAILVSASFAAGLNVYATVATLGLLGHYHLIVLPPALSLLQSWWTIGAAFALFVVEFFADKVPAFDLIWNALQTFVRVPIAALLAYGATANLSPQAQLASALLASLIALAAHGGKMAVRASVTTSPEPFSNIALSVGEDALAIGLIWLATRHPYISALIAVLLLVMIVVVVRWIWRAMRRLFQGAIRQWKLLMEEPI